MNPNDAKKLLKHMALQRVMENEVERYFSEVAGPEDLHQLEHDPSIKTTITDTDMLLFHVDMALDAGDEDAFMQLTAELRNMKGEESK